MASSVLANKARTLDYFIPIIRRKKHTDPSGLKKVFWYSILRNIVIFFLIFKFIDSGERERRRGRRRETNINQLFYPSMRSLADSCTCLDQGLNLQPWHIREDAPTNWTTGHGKTLLIHRISSTLALAPSQLFDQQLISQSSGAGLLTDQ